MSPSARSARWLRRIRSWFNPSQPVRPTVRQERGRSAEQLAIAYLRRESYEIEATNVRYRVGELDIVAREGNTLCFIEVRSASSMEFGPAVASITDRKRQHLVRAARRYLHHRRVRWTGDVRFDVVAIQRHHGERPLVELIRGAFEARPHTH